MANLVSNIDGVLQIYDDGTVNIVGGSLHIDNTEVLNNNNNALFSDVRVDTLDFGDSSPTLSDNGHYLRIQTSSGYTDIGSANTTYSHFYTDRSKYYFNKEIHVDSGEIRSHDEDLNLRRVGSSTARIGIGDGLTQSHQDFGVTGDVTISGDLTVSGTTTTLNTTNTLVKDAVLTLNHGQTTPANDIGLLFQRYSSPTSSNYNPVFMWEESTDRFIFGTTTELGADNDIGLNTQWMTIEGTGDVGIGTTNPLHKLDVHGTGRFTNTLNLERGDGTFLQLKGTSNNTGYINWESNGFTFYTNGPVEAFRIGPSGIVVNEDSRDYDFRIETNGDPNTLFVQGDNDHVGIGTNTPTVKFDVYDTTTWDTAHFSSNTGTGAGISLDATNTGVRWSLIAQGAAGGANDNNLGFHLTSAGTSGSSTGYKMVMTHDGRFGIGDMAPLGKLHVKDGDAGSITTNGAHDTIIVEGSNNTGINIFSPNTSYQYLAFGDTESSNSGYVRYQHSNNQMVLRAGGADTLYVNENKIGIETSSPDAVLDVNGDVKVGVSGKYSYFKLPNVSRGGGGITDEYIVVMRKYVTGTVQSSGMNGEIIFARGSTGTGNEPYRMRINMVSSYNTNRFQTFEGPASMFTSLDEIEISSVRYYALRVSPSGGGSVSNRFYFEGELYNDINDANLFTKVRESDATVTKIGIHSYPVLMRSGSTYRIMPVGNNGVGIGTDDPSTRLDVVHSNLPAEPYTGINVTNTSTSGATYTGVTADAKSQSHYRYKLNGALKWQTRVGSGNSVDIFQIYSWTQGADILNITGSNGYVGIGKTDPGTKLDVTGAITASSRSVFSKGIQANSINVGNDGDDDGDYNVTIRTTSTSDLYLQAGKTGTGSGVRVTGAEGLRVRSDDAFGEGINSSMIVGDVGGGENSQGYGYVELHAQDGKWNQLLHYHGGTGESSNKWRVGSHYNSTNTDDYYRFYARTPAKDMMRLNAETDSMEVNSYLKVDATTYITGSLQVGGSAGPEYRLDLADGVDTTPQDKLRFGVNNGASNNDSNEVGTGIIWKPRWTSYTKRSAGILQIGEGNYFKSGLAFYTNGSSNQTTDFSERMRIDMDGNVCIGQTEITYTQADQAPVVGARTNNKLHVNGSIQLLNNDDAIVFGRGTASFLKDEELGFGWGGGWYMTDGTYIRGRGSKIIYNGSNNIRTDKSFTTNSDGKDAWVDSSGNGRIAINGADSISAGQNSTIAISGGNGGYALAYMNRIDVGSDMTNGSNRLFDFYADGASKTRLSITSNGNIGWFMNTGSTLQTLDSSGTAIHEIHGNTSDRRTVMHSPMAKQHNSNGSTYPLGHYTPGETVFALDNTWSSKQVQEYFNNGNVSWNNQSDMGGGSLYINGGVSVGGTYTSGFPFIPIENTDYFYSEVWVKNVGDVAHYCGSIDYGYNYNNLGGNPGSYGYWIMSNTRRGASDYRKESAYIAGFGNNVGQFETGSKYFTPQALWNYSHYSGTRACYINGWKYIRVYQPGNRYFTGDVTAYYSSDERLKTNINTIEDAVHKIQQLHGVMFDWREETAAIIGKDANKREAGVIAQEVMKVMPELVEQRENGYYAVRYEKLTPLLIEAVKTQSYWIEDQKQMILEKNKTIEDVSNRLDTLEKLMKDILGK